LCVCKYVVMITTRSIGLTITIPGKGLAGCYQCVGSESTVDCKFQSHSILATLYVCKYVVMITTRSIGLTITIPGKGLAGCYQCIGTESIIDSEFQSHSILATLRIGKYVVMIATHSVGLAITIPGKGLAGCHQCIGSESTVDCKFQSHSILATLCICKYVIMITTGSIGLTISIPCKGLAGCYQCIGSESTVNGEFQSHSILASLCIGKYVVMITTRSIGLAITIPGKGLTGCYQCIGPESIIDSEFQSHSILATLRIGKYVVMIATHSVGLAITIPGKGLAGCYQCIGSESTVDCKF